MDAARQTRRIIALVALLNLGYFFVEMAVAWRIGSVSLFADAVDFLEDTAINVLILVALGRGARLQAQTAMLLAAIILLPGVAALVTAVQKLFSGGVPDAQSLTLTGLGALIVNVTAALLLVRLRSAGGSLMRAAFLSARNDALANVAIIAAGLVTVLTVSFWPDLIVGIGIAALNAGAAREVFVKARGEFKSAPRP